MCYLGRTDLAEILIDSGARVDLPNDVSGLIQYYYDTYMYVRTLILTL